MYPKLPAELENGNLPLLNSSEWILLNDIYFKAKTEIEHKYKFVPDGDDPKNSDSGDDPNNSASDDDHEKIEIILENMGRIFKHLKLCFEAKHRFIKGFPNWRKVRDRTIESLPSVGESLHLHRRNCNISKLVGNVTSFCGGTVCLISAALIPPTLGLSTPFAVAGGSALLLGTGTSTAAAITECVLLKKKVAKANTIISEDRAASEDLSSWLEHSCELSKALEFITNIDVMRDMMESIRESVLGPLENKNVSQRKKTVERVVADFLKLLPVAFESTTVICNAIEKFALLIYMLVTIVLLFHRNRVIFECAMLTFKSVIAVLSVLDCSIDAATAAVSLISGETAVARSVGAAVTRGTFALLSMTLDVVSVVLTSIDVRKGSISQEGKKMIDAANQLKEERDILQKVFNDVTHFEDPLNINPLLKY